MAGTPQLMYYRVNTAFGLQVYSEIDVHTKLTTIQKRREEERARLENERRKMAASVANNVKIGVVVPPHPSLLLEPVPPLPDELNYNLEPSAPFPPQPSPRQKPTPDTLRLPPSTAVPGVDRSTKPMSLLSPTSQQRLGLRTVVVPQILHAKFILLAQRSTEKNIETCGILAGRLDHDHLVISHLIVPKQHGGADYCNMDNEEEICEYSDQRELLTLGWIHTHPTQSAFLSSVDLHTHFSYQLMMPEAIAIVCAPKYQEAVKEQVLSSFLLLITPSTERILLKDLFNERRSDTTLGEGDCNTVLLILKPGCNLHLLSCSARIHFETTLEDSHLGTPQNGCGPIIIVAEPRLARASALSFPGIPS
ncbi:AMSH-like protease [Homalodisca vitripennis]|nr:AMSH-like protease [Homalodisca vitripennis]